MSKLTGAVIGAIVLGLATGASAEIVEETVTYDVNGETFEGFFARNDAFPAEEQPVVVIIHDWDGLGEYEQARARMLAEQGYAAFAADLYGQGVRGTSVEENRELSGALYADREAMRARMNAAVEQARQRVNGGVGIMGYCFGGAAVLEMARSGADLDAFVTFHAGLDVPEDQDFSQVAGPVLMLHGSQDPVAPMTQVAEVTGMMNEAGVDFGLHVFGGAEHSFTVWGSDDYRTDADLESWEAMSEFFAEELR